MDFTGFNDWNELGVESIAADPGNPAEGVGRGRRVHPAVGVPPDGEILRSGNQGRTWQIADLPIQLASNQDGRNMGERLAVDPRRRQASSTWPRPPTACGAAPTAA